MEASLPTPASVWAGFDPIGGPLDEEILRAWTEDGVAHKEVFFSAYIKGEVVRVYGVFAEPALEQPVGDAPAQTLPALLHMHGGGQTVAPHYLSWARRGYAILSINCHGEGFGREVGTFTVYPKVLRHGNHQGASSDALTATEPDLTCSSWWLWAAVNRRALTYLAAQPAVDANRIGIFGISMGGTSTWHVAIDKRVKAACAIYGIGWDDRPLFDRRFDPHRAVAEPTRAQREWNSGMAAQAYPPYIECPMLFLNASNDFHGNIDYVFDTFDNMPTRVPWRVAITPRFGHHIAASEGRDLLLWMETWVKGTGAQSHSQLPVWPQTPATKLLIDGNSGIPLLQIKVATNEATGIDRILVFYNIGNPEPKSRHWREIMVPEVDCDSESIDVALPTTDPALHMLAFANIHYDNGIVLTAPLVAGIPAQLGTAKATEKRSNLLYSGDMGVDGWLTLSPGTDPSPDAGWWPGPPLAVREGPHGLRGIAPENTARALMTFKIGDPQWRGPDGARLSFRVHSSKRQHVAVKVADKVVDGQAKEYIAVVDVQGLRNEWQHVVLATNTFAPARGELGVLSSWKELVVLSLLPPGDKPEFVDAGIIFADFEWLPMHEASL